MTQLTLAVLGGGLMGGGIAIDAARHGIGVLVYDVRPGSVDKLKERASGIYARWVASGRMDEAEASASLARILPAKGLEDAGARDLVIEAVFEDLEVKRNLLSALSPHLGRNTVVATNTSALRVGDLADALAAPERFLGLHYFSPAEVSRLVEVVRAEQTSVETVARAMGFLEITRRVPLLCVDTPGFVVNRFFCPYYNEAARIVQDGQGTPAEVDQVARERIGVAAGPFTVMNLIGPAVAANAMDNLSPLGPFYRSCARLAEQRETSSPWQVEHSGAPTSEAADEIERRLLGALFVPALELLNAEVATPEDMDRGAQLALRFGEGPCALMQKHGAEAVEAMVAALCRRDGHPQPPVHKPLHTASD